MADCNNSDNNKLSAAFPNSSNPENSANGLQIEPIANSLFDMNSLLNAARNFNALNQAVNQIIGVESRWFRSIPQHRSQDVIFQEYTLFNVEETPICIKVVLPDGNFPDSKYNYDLMGLEYEVPLEVHIDKRYWESLAGGGTAPQKKDIVYFPLPNKLYEVVSSYLHRGFMEQETTWKINLRKYQPEASRREGDALKETIEKYTVSTEEIFGEKIESDIKKLTDDKQMSPTNSTSRDNYKVLDPDLQLISSEVNIFGVRVAEAFYDLSSSRYYNAVTYNKEDKIRTDTDRCVTAWTMIDPGVVDDIDVAYIKPSKLKYPANFEIGIKSQVKRLQLGANIEISRPGSLNFYGKVIAVGGVGKNAYQIEVDQKVIEHLNSLKTNWYLSKNFKLKVQDPVSIIDGINDEKSNNGYKVDIYANQYIKIKYGLQEIISVIPDRLLDKEWYGVVINIANTFEQYSVSIYKQHPSDNKIKLDRVHYEVLDLKPEETNVPFYAVNKSPSFITNVRIYTKSMEEEHRMNDLLRYFAKDGDQLLVGDNCDLRMSAPYRGQQR